MQNKQDQGAVRLAIAGLVVLAIGAGLPTLLFGPLLGMGSSARLQAALTYAGVMVTAAVTMIGMAVKYQSDKRLMFEKTEQIKQLRLDAAMHAGQLLSPTGSGPAHPAAIASGLLALTNLGQADLAVALLVDLWASADDDAPGQGRVSTETAILVIDAALGSGSSNAQLVAAELLCRNSASLEPGQSLYWPSSIEGRWIPGLSHRATLLIIEAIVRSTLACKPHDHAETALRSAAVRLYGISRDVKDGRVRGCIGKLICPLIPRLEKLHYNEFVQGDQTITIQQLKDAAASPQTNPDSYLNQISTNLAEELAKWANEASGIYTGPGCLAAAEHSPDGGEPHKRRELRLRHAATG